MLLMIKVGYFYMKVVIEMQNTYTLQTMMPDIGTSIEYHEIGGSNLHTKKNKFKK